MPLDDGVGALLREPNYGEPERAGVFELPFRHTPGR
jgi:hypothetical protein